LFDLKIDPKLPHHYIISVGMKPMTDKDAGKIYLKHGPLYFTNQDVENVRSAAILSKDKLFKTDSKQALQNFKCLEIASSIRGMQLAAYANDCTVHHFSSAFVIGLDWFETLVDLANTSEHNKELLEKSRVR
jgi:hypothetical protein